jgi:hypothetical protein
LRWRNALVTFLLRAVRRMHPALACRVSLLAVALGAGCAGRIGGDAADLGSDEPRDLATASGDGPPADLARPADLATTPRDLGTQCEPPTAGTRQAPPFGPPQLTTSGLLVRVMNHCPFPLWVVGQGNDGNGGTHTLSPDNLALQTDQTQDYDAQSFFGSARVTVYRDGSMSTPAQFVELNYGNGQLGYNVSYVDFLGLPVEVAASCGTTACYAPLATLLDGCPSNLRQGDRCVSPRSWCAGANAGSAYCHALDATAQAALQLPECQTDLAAYRAQYGANAPIGATPSVYACTDFWSASPFCCAVVNRGVVGATDPSDYCGYYQTTPYNTYAKWVHEKCPVIYAFPYDDAEGQSGYHQCAAKEIRITWCPGG